MVDDLHRFSKNIYECFAVFSSCLRKRKIAVNFCDKINGEYINGSWSEGGAQYSFKWERDDCDKSERAVGTSQFMDLPADLEEQMKSVNGPARSIAMRDTTTSGAALGEKRAHVQKPQGRLVVEDSDDEEERGLAAQRAVEAAEEERRREAMDFGIDVHVENLKQNTTLETMGQGEAVEDLGTYESTKCLSNCALNS